MKIRETMKSSKKTPKSKSPGRIVNVVAESRIIEVVYQTALGLHSVDAISKTTMREFEGLCLPQVPNYTPEEIKAIRDRCNASQKVFAAYMNISPSAVQKWETGARRPDSVALKLLNLVAKKGLEILVV